MTFRVCLDFDGVIADYHSRLCAYIREMHDIAVSPDEITTWNQQLPGGDISLSECVAATHTDADFLAETPAVPGAIQGITDLLTADIDIHVATHRPASIHREIDQWLASRGLDALTPIAAVPDNKGLIPCDVLVDDRPQTIRQCRYHQPTAIHHVETWGMDPVAGAFITEDWDELQSRIHRIGRLHSTRVFR